MSAKRILYIQEATGSAGSNGASGLPEACLSLTPKIGHYPTGELLLDVAGTQRCLGGEQAILSRLKKIGEHFPIQKTVVADRPEWVKPLATDSLVVIPPGKSQRQLFSLPVDRIPLLGEPVIEEGEWKERHRLVAFMRRVGLTHIADFAKLPPLAINRRFGKMGILLHQWTLGKRELPIPTYSPSEPLSETIDVHEATHIDALCLLLLPVFKRFEHRLEGRKELMAQLCFRFHLEMEGLLTSEFRLTEPTADTQRVLKLLCEFFNSLTWDAPLLTLSVTVSDTVPSVPAQLSLFDATENTTHDISQFIYRLKIRYEGIAVGSPLLRESYLPERGWELMWPAENAQVSSFFDNRPLFLFANPIPIPPPRGRFPPSEKIETDWWTESPKNRTYFVTDSPHNSHSPNSNDRLWIFQDGDGRWFCHGIF